MPLKWSSLMNIKTDDYLVTMATPSAELVGMPNSGAFIIGQLQEMMNSREYDGKTSSAYDEILKLADRIEHHELTVDDRKAIADTLRYLAQFASLDSIPVE